MRNVLFLFFISLMPFIGKAQSWKAISTSTDYICGIGNAETVAEADKKALADLASCISVFVSNNTEMGFKEENNNGQIDHRSFVDNRIKTYSRATLTNTERIIIENEPKAVVGRYIKKSELSRIFESRKLKSLDMISSAIRAEKLGKVDDALRNYYWALALIRSLQYPEEVTYIDDDNHKHIVTNWIPEQMGALLDNLKVKVVSRKDDDVELSFAYCDKPVSSVDYTYFDGRDWSPINSAKDGIGILELAKGNQSDKYQLRIEYEYISEAHIDKEVEDVLSVIEGRPVRKSYITINAEPVAGVAYNSTESFSETDKSDIKTPYFNEYGINKHSKAIKEVIESIRTGKADKVSSYFTKEGLEIFKTLIFSYGKAKIIDTPTPVFYNDNNNGMVARGIKVSFTFSRGVRKTFVEDLVFTFDEKALINNVAFGLGKTAEDDILNKGVWNADSRKVLMAFLENYKTAYALKRLDYINTIFDDDAVIIVANVVKRSQGVLTDGMSYINDKIIKYNRYSKDQYLKNLSRCFSANEYINIRFANNDVMKLGKGGETYGIQIAQDYYSSTYGDKGYLFLEVDVNNPKQPIIKVRTWQPEKDPNFGLYGPGDFK